MGPGDASAERALVRSRAERLLTQLLLAYDGHGNPRDPKIQRERSAQFATVLGAFERLGVLAAAEDTQWREQLARDESAPQASPPVRTTPRAEAVLARLWGELSSSPLVVGAGGEPSGPCVRFTTAV